MDSLLNPLVLHHRPNVIYKPGFDQANDASFSPALADIIVKCLSRV